MDAFVQDLMGQGWVALGSPTVIAFTFLRVVIIYLFLLGMLKLAGKRTLGQMTPFDLLTLLLLSNVVQNAMVGPDNSLTGGLIGAIALLGLNRWISKSRLRNAIEGQPTVLIKNGQPILENLQREDLTPAELLSALREHGVQDYQEVTIAVLEPDGTISVVPVKEATVRRVRRLKSSRNR